MTITRLAHDDRTKNYRDRRRTEGLHNPDIIRCLKRHIIRDVYQALNKDLNWS